MIRDHHYLFNGLIAFISSYISFQISLNITDICFYISLQRYIPVSMEPSYIILRGKELDIILERKLFQFGLISITKENSSWIHSISQIDKNQSRTSLLQSTLNWESGRNYTSNIQSGTHTTKVNLRLQSKFIVLILINFVREHIDFIMSEELKKNKYL
jgi:hypothetical protein